MMPNISSLPCGDYRCDNCLAPDGSLIPHRSCSTCCRDQVEGYNHATGLPDNAPAQPAPDPLRPDPAPIVSTMDQRAAALASLAAADADLVMTEGAMDAVEAVRRVREKAPAISDEAVEAFFRVWYPAWVTFSDEWRSKICKSVRAALTAAAPHLCAAKDAEPFGGVQDWARHACAIRHADDDGFAKDVEEMKVLMRAKGIDPQDLI